MLKHGLLNPRVLSLVSRVRHTNTLVIADQGFPFWPELETVDLSLVSGIPTVLQVVEALLPTWHCGGIWMAREFKEHNARKTVNAFRRAFQKTPLHFEPHVDFKKRVPDAIGLIRTGDPTLYSNLILESA